MSCSTGEQPEEERCGDEVQGDELELMLDIEREVMGSDYGVTSYTTRAEAERIGQLLGLRPGIRLLDLGAGSGWPGLFLARTTGCKVTLVDKPLSGLRAATERAGKDRLSADCSMVVGDGKALPFQRGWFHAICHSDVLC